MSIEMPIGVNVFFVGLFCSFVHIWIFTHLCIGLLKRARTRRHRGMFHLLVGMSFPFVILLNSC